MAEQSPKSSFIKKIFFKQKISKPPIDIPSQAVQDLSDPTKQHDLLKRLLTKGTVFDKGRMSRILSEALATSYYRRTFYRECEQAASHSYVSAALDLYVDSVTAPSKITNKSIWVTSEDKKLENTLNQFLEEIALEERIRDWAGQLAMYGDFFIEPVGREGIGVAFVDDSIHPADMERIDINGRLEGFVRTGLYQNQSIYTADVDAPWRYTHFRIFGVAKKMLNTALGIFGEPGRMFSLEQERFKDKKFRYTTKYGVSLLTPAIPIYKRLKMAEDSLLMARITRGITYYLYKIKVSGGNIDSAAELVQSYSEYLKRQTGLDLTTGQEQWKDRWAPVFAQVEDLFVPESDDITVSHDQLGGDANIKAIVDIELLVNQLLGSLRVSKAMLGITDELPGAIGEGAAVRISINFAKNAYRLQTGLKQGIKRLCQIHLAYLNQNPDPTRFEINSGDISSAEEEELKNALDKGVDVVDKLAEMLLKFAPDIDRMELLNYLNQKFLRLDDLDISTMLGKGGELTAEAKQELKRRFERGRKVVAIESDCLSYLPGNQILRLNENRQVVKENRAWEPFKVKFTNNGGKGK